MKIDKSNPKHWLYLFAFSITVVLAALLRIFKVAQANNVCVLYGHKLTGNLKALYDYNRTSTDSTMQMVFLTMDPHYYRQLKSASFNVINGTNPLNALKLARASSLVSDHGLHTLSLLHKFTSIPFFDVWHAIPLKGFDEEDFRPQRHYEKVFVTSERVRQVYTSKFGFNDSQVVAIGYARTDLLVNQSLDVVAVRNSLGIEDASKKIFLFAPTWAQDDPTRDIFPFGEAMTDFFKALEKVCIEANALCIFRTHLNSGEACLDEYESIIFRPYSHYPDTEAMLLITDCLVSDWSSIVFDYMILNRPTIFLDVPAPFRKGFSLGPEHRFGKIVANLSELQSSLITYLQNPAEYLHDFGVAHKNIEQALYDENADGEAAKRICAVLKTYHK